MSWLQITLSATRVQVPRLVEALENSGALSVSIEGAQDEEIFQAALEPTALWSRNHVTGLFPQSTDMADVLRQVREHFGAPLPDHRIDTLPDAEWARVWMARYAPLHVGRNLWVCPTWCTPPDGNAINVFLDPGLAFGTGAHPTTALCLQWLSEQMLTGLSVIDYGCGSGILAIAALKLGARDAYAVDVDPLALIATRQNGARNDVADRLTPIAPEALAPNAAADLVLANILAGPLITLAPRLCALVRPGGRILLTGVLNEQARDVRARYAPGFAFEIRVREEWTLLAGTKHGGG